MPTTKKKRRKKAKTPVIVCSLVIACVLAAILVIVVYFRTSDKPLLDNQTAASQTNPSEVSVYRSDTSVQNDYPEEAAAPVENEAAVSPYTIDEVLYEDDGVRVARIHGKNYRAVMAEISDTDRISVGTCGTFGLAGKTVLEMADNYGALLAINGGEFEDASGDGNGGTPMGNVIVDDEVLWGGGGATVGMDHDGKLYAGWFSSSYCQSINLRWALSYGPTLITDGEIQSVTDNLREPRTIVGQREDGTVIFLCIAGRQPAALGVTNQESADIMADLGCINAGNLDGGASSYMVLNGEYINISNTGGAPRPVPDIIYVLPPTETEVTK